MEEKIRSSSGEQLKWTIKEWPWDIQKKGNTEKWSVRTSACSGGLPWSSGYACMHACVCMCLCVYVCASVCPGVSTPAQTEWVGSVGWLSGLAWSSVDPPPGQFSVRPCQGQPPARGGGSGGQGGGDASAWPPGTLCLIATAKALAHTHLLLEWTLTPIQGHTIKSW